jgi:hypothetical protein
MQFDVPILLIFFNRFDTTQKVFESVRAQKPKILYLAADGPRNETEKSDIDKIKQYVQQVDWPCTVRSYFKSQNTGARIFIGEAVGFMFQHEEQGIILEHDCLPHPDFFEYCKHMLHTFRDEEKIMHITGTCFQDRGKPIPGHFFSYYNHIWGWATWKRAWQHYDLEMKDYSEYRNRDFLLPIFPDANVRKYWYKKLDAAYHHAVGSWDYQWSYALWKQAGLSVAPASNLVSNIGFGAGAIHTKDPSHFLSNRPTYAWQPQQAADCPPPLADRKAEAFDFQFVFYPPLLKRIINRIKAGF